ncbi:MAG: hypothetical protein SGARI_000704 [Bacillariaceae sp.]
MAAFVANAILRRLQVDLQNKRGTARLILPETAAASDHDLPKDHASHSDTIATKVLDLETCKLKVKRRGSRTTINNEVLGLHAA